MATQRIQQKNWVFTSFNMDIDWEHLDIQAIDTKKSIKYVVYQGEYTKEHKKHIQGYIQFDKKKDMNYVKRLFKDNTLHLEVQRGTPEQASDYCKKTDKDGEIQETFFSYIEYGELDITKQGQRTDLMEIREMIKDGHSINSIMLTTESHSVLRNCIQYNRTLTQFQHTIQQDIHRTKVKDRYENVIWRPIQQKIHDIIDEQLNNSDSRTVNWIFDYKGNTGKTYLARYYMAQGNTYYITGGKQADILYSYSGQPIIIYDLARTYSDNMEHIYTTIENLKNGMYLSTKYNTEQRLYDTQPVILVLSNFMPDTPKLSEDRWNIINTEDYIYHDSVYKGDVIDTKEGIIDTKEGIIDTKEGIIDTKEGIIDTKEDVIEYIQPIIPELIQTNNDTVIVKASNDYIASNITAHITSLVNQQLRGYIQDTIKYTDYQDSIQDTLSDTSAEYTVVNTKTYKNKNKNKNNKSGAENPLGN